MLDQYLATAIVATTLLSLIFMVLPSRYIPHSPQKSDLRVLTNEPDVSIQILVLGDIGRSPRMQYHAISIANHGGRVDIVGYQESTLHPDLINNSLVNIISLPRVPEFLHSKTSIFTLTAPLKVLWQTWTLIRALGFRTKPSRWLLVQNPPSIPTLLIAFIICFLRNTHLIVDWHNIGWTLLAGTRGFNHPLVCIYKYYEVLLGSWAPTINFTVTDSMRRELKKPPYNFSSPILTLHDRPADIFKPITERLERLRFLEQLQETINHASDILNGNTKLIVSSTSWTHDEDFSILLEALSSYASQSQNLPSLLVIITGKGPQKDFYLGRIASLNSMKKLNKITISTCWLSMEHYAKLLACADLGVCLHMSSSGLDLPMKVIDMFGAGLPVVGYSSYQSWKELVIDGINGRGFSTSEELCSILRELFAEKNGVQLLRLRNGAMQEVKRTWDDEWDRVAGRVLGFCD